MLSMKERLGIGKKTEPLKTKTTEYCHETFTQLCVRLFLKPAELLREIAIIACLVFKHERFTELEQKLQKTRLNQSGIVDEVINCYLDNKQANVISINRDRYS